MKALTWDATGRIMDYAGLKPTNLVLKCVLWELLGSILSMLLSHPLGYYKDVVVEARHKRKTNSFSSWLRTTLTRYLWVVLVGVPCSAGLVWTIERAGDGLLPWLMLFSMGFFILFSTIVPVIITYSKKKPDPLQPGELYSKIRSLAHQVGFPLEGVYVRNESTNCSETNICFNGPFWSERVVLDGALLDRFEVDEIVALVARELGDWHHSHLLKYLTLYHINLYLYLSVLSNFIPSTALPLSFGFGPDAFTPSQKVPPFVNFQLAQTVLHGVYQLYSWLSYSMTHKHVLKADEFAVGILGIDDLRAALIKSSSRELGSSYTDWLYAMVQDSQPNLAERLEALDKLGERNVEVGEVKQKKDL
ncbi:hypothetical protein IAR50_006325 [Cryptococcus sp. DSM 104548]